MSRVINNPILPGFNPDPSIVRVGNDYYIATSTFEWFPGVQILHSKDLINWRLISRPLNRTELLDMTGVPDSGGIWAPCLTWHEGLFYLIYTNVKRLDGSFKDTHNYLSTCESIEGDWSAPTYLTSSGFDPSLFHDDDGRQWLLNMVWDYRPNYNSFGGIYLQEYSAEHKKMVGPIHNIFLGTHRGLTEAPHLYKRNGYYYLLTAEGGTGYEHVITMARSNSIFGPYEIDPSGYVLSAKSNEALPLQRAGHGDIVETPGGEFFLVYLCSRPIAGKKRSSLGRETAIQQVRWTQDNWLRLASGGNTPELTSKLADGPSQPWPSYAERDDFTQAELAMAYQWLRTSRPERLYSLAAREGYLRLYGRESVGSCYEQALVARRQQDFCYTATTKVEFEPEHFQQLAGLICYYNRHKYHYLYISNDPDRGKHIGIMSCAADQSEEASFPLLDNELAGGLFHLPKNVPIYLRADVDIDQLLFSWSLDEKQWHTVPCELDYSVLSDEAGKGEGNNFTGTFVGMCCQDLAGTAKHADFDFFDYQVRR
ncbi:MAG: glycoside hydrolase family 43 protein [Spongiibacteraceae bacterium]|nr:glycoside hydrolase family 43 protein [Spongiibacteraceae bacterium]